MGVYETSVVVIWGTRKHWTHKKSDDLQADTFGSKYGFPVARQHGISPAIICQPIEV